MARAATMRTSHRSTGTRPKSDLDHALAAGTMVLGLAALVVLALDGNNAVAFWLALAGVLAGLVGQYLSRTRGERFADIAGLVASALALAVAASQGGMP